jgi:nitroimidazol reductase NimA-like FMN-containing flavoprotein (pyridoxamine 5'-phosphate oxidase superfamily)
VAPKIISAEENIGMNEKETVQFLSNSASTILLGTVDAQGEPNIHPTWFYFDDKSSKLYLFTGSKSRKVGNIRKNPRVYFDVDDDQPPYKGVRGKADARILPKGGSSVALTGKIIQKYLPLSDPVAKEYLEEVEEGEAVVIELSPRYFSTWDNSKAH